MAPEIDSLVTRLRQSRLDRRTEHPPVRAATWDLIKVALLVPVATAVLLAVLISLAKAFAGGGMHGLPSEVGAGWLTVHLVPLTVGDTTVGALPLVPALLMIAAVAAVTSRAARNTATLSEVGTIAGAALGGPLLATALSLAVVADGSAVSSLGQADPLIAFGQTLLVQTIGVAIGVGRRCLQPLFDQYEFPVTDRVGARAGLIAFAALVAGGAVLVFAGLILNWSLVGDLIAEGHSADGYLGLTVLSILYLPNLALAALGLSVGAEVSVGTAAVDVFGTDPGTLPPLPILGVVPEYLGGPGLLVLLIPALTGVLVGWYCRSIEVIKHLRAVGMAAVVAGSLAGLGASMAAGVVGEIGRFGSSAPLTGLCVAGWIAVVGALCAGVHQLLPGTRAARRENDGSFDLDELLAGEEFVDLEIVDDPDAEIPAVEDLEADAGPAAGDAVLADTDVLDPVDDESDPGGESGDCDPGDDPRDGAGRDVDPVAARRADGD